MSMVSRSATPAAKAPCWQITKINTDIEAVETEIFIQGLGIGDIIQMLHRFDFKDSVGGAQMVPTPV
jgi:hypothetical protein